MLSPTVSLLGVTVAGHWRQLQESYKSSLAVWVTGTVDLVVVNYCDIGHFENYETIMKNRPLKSLH